MHTTINRALTAISTQPAFIMIEAPPVSEVKAADEVGAIAPVFDPAV
jgi:hypothetical protein